MNKRKVIRVLYITDPIGDEGYYTDSENTRYTYDQMLSKMVMPHEERYLLRKVNGPFMLKNFEYSKYIDYFLMFERLWLKSKEFR